MNLNWDFPYPSRRMPIFARNVVATSQPLAAQAGLQMLARGGNALDAALAAAITLTVVEPTGNGIGSDLFALVWDGRELHGLNGSGRSPAGWTPERFRGAERMPKIGWDTVTVPGAVDAWATLSGRFGRLPFADLFEPAIRYATDGFVVSPFTAARWAETPLLYAAYPDFAAAFLPGGRSPRTGERFRQPDQAATLAKIADTKGESLYRGELASRIAACAGKAGGALSVEDLARHRSEWVTPLAVDWNGVTLHELPPNGQGVAVLIALGILRELSIDRYPLDSAESVHLQVEAMKRAFALAERHVADPGWMTIDPASLLEKGRLAEIAGTIAIDRAQPSLSALPYDGGTVYLTAADQNGWIVSCIQSNFKGFGSGIVVPGTGISLQNRGIGFTLERGHPNEVAPGKRPYHTIIPAFVTRDGAPLAAFGVMGGHMQAQGHLQVMLRVFSGRQNPQAALDAPRWYVDERSRLWLEPGFAPAVREGLLQRGHPLAGGDPGPVFGGAQFVHRLPDGYCAASDPRKDGQAVGF